MRKLLLLLLPLMCLYLGSTAQKKNKKSITFTPAYRQAEDSLEKFAAILINDPDENVRLDANFKLIRLLVKTIKMENAFYYPFDSLKSVGILRDKDNTFRIFSWHYKASDDSYRYYGVIQKNNPKKAEYYPFFDFSNQIDSPLDTVLTNNRWYGAHYYTLLENKSKGTKFYTLLGWKAYSTNTGKKVVETLIFDKEGKPVFGFKPIIQNPIDIVKDSDPVFKNRIIFQFKGDATMLLRYLKKEKLIIFDHLVPIDISAKGFYDAYVPDLSYDGFKFKNGKWVLIENIKLENPPNPLDKLYNDPLKN